jgi:hypothetical protein
MLLGLLSDTHGRADAARQGLRLLQEAGAEFFIHCGDVGGEPVLDTLAGLPNAVVWGNNDIDRVRLARYADSIGVHVHDPFARLAFDGLRLLVTHGDDWHLLDRAVRDNLCDLLLCGHTHVPADQRRGKVRVFNPGALYRARQKTVATLDTVSGAARWIPLPH